jgi:hypothetical protein
MRVALGPAKEDNKAMVEMGKRGTLNSSDGAVTSLGPERCFLGHRTDRSFIP